MGVINVLKTFFVNFGKTVQLQAEIREGIANQADLFNRKLEELVKQQADQSARSERLLREILAGQANQTNVLNQRLKELIQERVNTNMRK